MVHDTVTNKLSLILIPSFIDFLDSEDELKREIIEVQLDKKLAQSDKNFGLLFSRYGRSGNMAMIVTNVATLFHSAEFRNCLQKILTMFF